MRLLDPVPTELAASLPGLVLRAFDPTKDHRAVAEFICAVNAADGSDFMPSEEVMRDEYRPSERFDPATDVLLAEVRGGLVGIADTSWRARETAIDHEVGVRVHPAWRRRGLGTVLRQRLETRARVIAAVGAGGSGPRRLTMFVEDATSGASDFAAAADYAPGIYGFEMRRPLDRPIEPVALPHGLEVRPVRPEDHRAIWDADCEAFLDHHDPTIRDDNDFRAWFAQPTLDTSLWRVAWAGDEVAGSVMTFVWTDENERLGVRRAWLEHVSVRRPWRGRGVARALISATLEMLQAAGFEDAKLGVHGDNPTGAVGVYERCGFEIHHRWTVWRKPL